MKQLFVTTSTLILLSLSSDAVHAARGEARGQQETPWRQVTELSPSDPEAGDRFGESAAINMQTLVVGSPFSDDTGESSGAAYIFEQNQSDPDNWGHWGQVKKLVASDAVAGAQAAFGGAVALDGDTIVVGAFGDDISAFNSGAAYVFERNFGGDSMWGQVAKLTPSVPISGEYFGVSVAISGSTIIVGANHNGGASGPGSAYVFDRDDDLGKWVQTRKLSASQTDDRFGESVTIDSDTVIVGAPRADSAGNDSGIAYVFTRDEGGVDNWGEVAMLIGSDTSGGTPSGDQFGISVSILLNTAVVGAYLEDDAGENAGATYVFERNEGGVDKWGEVAKLTTSDAGAGDLFGMPVAIEENIVLAGALGSDGAVNDSGAAYVFIRDADAWIQAAKLVPLDGMPGDEFGESLSISGIKVVIGSHKADGTGTDSGSAYVFQKSTSFLRVPISGDQLIKNKYISAVVDHSIPTDYNCNSNGSCDAVVLAFSGEEGQAEFGQNVSPPGYRQDCNGTPFDFAGAITYQGTQGGDTGDCSGPDTDPDATHYLDYDGHSGTDFKYSTGRAITAAADGWLEIPTEDTVNGGDPTPHDEFNTLRIIHSNGFETWYLHAKQGTECLAFPGGVCVPGGVAVISGQKIAEVGNTGTTGPHLHFEARQGPETIIDPFGCEATVQVADPDACVGYLWIPVIFTDGFESGDTTAWSSAVP